MDKLLPKINWISFDKDNPPKDIPFDTECLIFLREKYTEEWEYSVDIAIPYGKYLDNFWNTNVDWKEGQDVEVLAYAQLPYAQKESELIKIGAEHESRFNSIHYIGNIVNTNLYEKR